MEAIQRLWQSRLRRDTVLLIALQIVYRSSGVVFFAILSRCVPARDIGAYVFTLIANFLLNPILMRRVAADPGRAATPFAPLLGFRLVSSLLYLLCVSVTAIACTGAIW